MGALKDSLSHTKLVQLSMAQRTLVGPKKVQKNLMKIVRLTLLKAKRLRKNVWVNCTNTVKLNEMFSPSGLLEFKHLEACFAMIL